MRRFYDIERDTSVTLEDLKEEWDSRSPEEQQEYNGKFEHYLSACMFFSNGGTLIEL